MNIRQQHPPEPIIGTQFFTAYVRNMRAETISNPVDNSYPDENLHSELSTCYGLKHGGRCQCLRFGYNPNQTWRSSRRLTTLASRFISPQCGPRASSSPNPSPTTSTNTTNQIARLNAIGTTAVCVSDQNSKISNQPKLANENPQFHSLGVCQ